MEKLEIMGDFPKKEIKQDLFGYSNFAENVAKYIIDKKDESGLIISINAPWGYGKTTCLNFIKEHLVKKANTHIICFNPWVVSENKTDIILKFLHSLGDNLSDIINEQETSNHNWWKNTGKKIGFFIRRGWRKKSNSKIRHFTTTPKVAEFSAIWKALLNRISSDVVSELDKVYENIDVQKQKIEELLQEHNKQIVVFVDDLDRLDKDEIRQIFRLLKAIADFKFLTYVVAFDQTVVSNALEQDFCNNGYEYLNKIVQVPLTLPKIYQEDLYHILLKKFNNLLNVTGYKIDQDSNYRFYKLNQSLISKHIKSLREINRLFNGFIVNFMQIYQDVDFIDFITIEILRIYEPKLYFEIRNNLNMYIDGQLFISEKEKEKYFKKISELYPDKIEIIKDLFPYTNKPLGGSAIYDNNREEEWHKNKRICAKRRVNNYFGLRIDSNDISDRDALQFLDTIKTESELDYAINEWGETKGGNGKRQLSYWLEKLDMFTDKIIQMNLSQIFVNIAFKYVNSFNDLSDIENTNLFNIDNDLRFKWLVKKILNGTKNEKERFDIIKQALTNSNNLSAITEFLRVYRDEIDSISDNKYEKATITKEHLKELENILENKMGGSKNHIRESRKTSKVSKSSYKSN